MIFGFGGKIAATLGGFAFLFANIVYLNGE
jgi:hypothetical protein